MTEQYVPTTREVREMYVRADRGVRSREEYESEFNRWLAKRDAEVAAKALEDAARWMQNGIGEPYNPRETNYAQQAHEAKARRAWLRARAAEYRKAVQS